MKKIIVLAIFVFAVFIAGENVFAQKKYKDITIILMRHAEKDKQDEEFGNSIDPRLSEEGNKRAQKLAEVLTQFKPDAIYSSKFNRTLSTVAPYARGKRMQVQFYDHRNLKEIAQLVQAGDFQTIVVAGHNSTTPALTNLLISTEKYKALGENEYDKIFIVKLRKNKNEIKVIEEKMITY
jgi:2,3-bisphosphoglycerate-dependent phosphoglycerate mutase